MSTSAFQSSQLVLYDIKPKDPVEQHCYAPNPWKARFALNFKSIPYSTSWTNLPDVAETRKKLNVPAGRKFADGSDFYTLPVLHDKSNGELIGDSFDIAVYLQQKYPDSGAGELFPDQKIDYEFKPEFEILVPLSDPPPSAYPEYSKFNTNVDAAFTTHVQLGTMGMPLDTACADESKQVFIGRAAAYGITKWEDFALIGEAREKMKHSFKSTLAVLADLYRKDASGPFLLGSKASYADIIVGAWLQMLSRTLPDDEWQEIKSWHDGIFGKLHDGLQVFGKVI